VAAGNLLKPGGVGAVAALLVFAAGLSQPAPALLAAFFLALAGLARLWCRLAIWGVTVERRFRGRRFFPGEPIRASLRVANRKPLPLAWVEVEQELPAAILPEGHRGPEGRGGSRHGAALLAYREVAWELKLTAPRRGYYPLGNLRATSGDLLGLYTRTRTFPRGEPLIVYPRIHPLDTRAIPSLHPMGAFPAPRRHFQDPTHAVGVRPWRPGDSLRRIHWKASARSLELQVKVLAATTDFKAALALDVESFRPEEGLEEEAFELAISISASVAAALSRGGSPVGLVVNTRLADTGLPAVLLPAAGPERLAELLEALAKVTAQPSGPLAGLLDACRARLAAGTTVVAVAGRPPATLPGFCAELAQSGLKPLVILVGDHPAPPLPPQVPLRRIRSPEELAAMRPEGP
jgi:uncharacterized protein (DUF58 family)